MATTVPRTTHQWLQPLYRWLNGLGTSVFNASGIAKGAWVGSNSPVSMLGNSTGVVGFYGSTGLPLLAAYGGITGTSSVSSGINATGVGGSGFMSALSQVGFNGGTGTIVTINDIVKQLKNMGILTA